MGFITLNGLFGHLWYEGSVFHEGLNMIAERIGGQRIAEANIPIEEIEQKVPFVEFGYLANFVLILGRSSRSSSSCSSFGARA